MTSKIWRCAYAKLLTGHSKAQDLINPVFDWDNVFSSDQPDPDRLLESQLIAQRATSALRITYWVKTLQILTNTKSNYQLEKVLFYKSKSEEHFYESRPKIIEKYLRGTKPSQRTLAKIEEKIPGSRHAYENPIWDLLPEQYPWKQQFVWNAMSRLLDPLPQMLFSTHHHSTPLSFPRKLSRYGDLLTACSELPAIEELALRVALIRESQANGDQNICFQHLARLNSEWRAIASRDIILEEHIAPLIVALSNGIFRMSFDREVLETHRAEILDGFRKGLEKFTSSLDGSGDRFDQ